MTQIKVKQISDKTTKLVEIAGTQTITGDKTLSGTTTISGSIGLGSTATATTQASNDNSTKVATTDYVAIAVAAVSGSSATTNIQTVSTTSNITLTAPITLIRCTNVSNVTLTLPNASTVPGYQVTLKKCAGGQVDIGTSTAQIFLDSTTLIGTTTKLSLLSTGQTWTLTAHSSGWDVI